MDELKPLWKSFRRSPPNQFRIPLYMCNRLSSSRWKYLPLPGIQDTNSPFAKWFQAPLCVEGWDEALHEIGKQSYETVLSSEKAAALLKAVESLPVLVIGGAEDALVPLKSVQAMASKLVNSRLVAISGCGHLPHEECPKALLAAMSPFINRILV